MFTSNLSKIFVRELDVLHAQIEAYSSDDILWQTAPGIANSGGNLALHLIGNLNHFIGTTLGKTGYVRNRELEFTANQVPRDVIYRDIAATKNMIQDVLPGLSDEVLAEEYPLAIRQQKSRVDFTLVHLLSHLSYHIGQINYHRRLLDKK